MAHKISYPRARTAPTFQLCCRMVAVIAVELRREEQMEERVKIEPKVQPVVEGMLRDYIQDGDYQ